jgi:hypothetical protein
VNASNDRLVSKSGRLAVSIFLDCTDVPHVGGLLRAGYAAVLLLLWWPASAEVRLDYTFSQWERLHADDRAAYIARSIDMLGTMAGPEPAQKAARHYSQCLMRSQLTARQLASFLREYVSARPELQGSSVQHAINDYLHALCGRPAD